nr:PREDICTED: uncharacterized protein LOC109041298 [Bemisia tabaci]
MSASIRFVCVALCLVSVHISGINSERSLCDVCACSPNSDEPIRISCDCQKSKMLFFKEEDEQTLMQTEELRISACNFLSLPANGFVRATKLRHLRLDSLNYFHFFRGVFPYLETLHVDRVANFIFAELSLSTGKQLERITLRHTNLKELPPLALHEARGLKNFDIHGCNITTVAPGALFNANNTNSPLGLRITDSVISQIMEDGINILGEELVVRNSTIGMLGPRSVTAAVRNFAVATSTFTDVNADSLHVKAAVINISGNAFAALPPPFLSDLHITDAEPASAEDMFPDEDQRVKIEFVNNYLDDIDLSAFFLKLRYREVNFQKNRIDCDCAPARTAVFKLPTLFPGLSPMANRTAYEYIIEHNYCAQQNVSLGEYGRQFLGGAVCSDRALNDAPTELNEITDEPIPQKNLLAAGAAVSHSLCLWFIVAVPLLRLT